MPELPEVETIVRQLRAEAGGKVFSGAELRQNGRGLPSRKVLSLLKGKEVLDVKRRGKFIIFILSGGYGLVVHLRMTGRLMWEKTKGGAKHVRMVFNFKDGSELIFSDTRKFGRVWLGKMQNMMLETGMGKLGPEPFEIDGSVVVEIYGKRRGILKNSLLRQDLVAGIGNIYADEICFRSGLHPSSRLEKLNLPELKRLHRAMIFCLREGIRHCGVSVSDFVGTRGDLGKHQKFLQVYGRKGDMCRKCGSMIMKTVVAGRGTHFCVVCQKKY